MSQSIKTYQYAKEKKIANISISGYYAYSIAYIMSLLYAENIFIIIPIILSTIFCSYVATQTFYLKK